MSSSGYVSPPRRCVCGDADRTVMLRLPGGDLICRSCWIDTTRIAPGRQPGTPTLDEHMRRIEEREASA